MSSADFSVRLCRTLKRRTDPSTLTTQVEEICRGALTGGRGAGYRHKVYPADSPTEVDGLYRIERLVKFTCDREPKDALDRKRRICEALMRKGQAAPYSGKYPWMVQGVNEDQQATLKKIYSSLADEGKVDEIACEREIKEKRDVKNYGDIVIEPNGHFDHIFGREDQLKIILSALRAAKDSNLNNRFHCVLYGLPGTAKTDLCMSVGKMLGQENEDYMLLDGTSTTEAGIQRILLESLQIPPVLIINEIEKAEEKSLRWLLGVLDHTGRVQKTNFNVGNKARNVKMLGLATVNDIGLFKKVLSGALYSRFAHEIHCPRPSREVMAKILEREVLKVDGNLDWIEPTLKFCYDILRMEDVRKIVPICLCGKDDLFDGSYQNSILNTIDPASKF